MACDSCSNSRTPPNKAAWLNHFHCLEEVTTRENVNMKDEDGCTPLHRAALKGNFELVQWLLDSNLPVEIDSNDYHGNTPLHKAIQYEKIVELLLEKGASPIAPDQDGNTVLNKAVFQGYLPSVKLLIRFASGKFVSLII